MIRIEQNRAYNLHDYSAVLDLQVSTAADLPAINGEVGIWKILPGSIAQIIQSGIFCTLDDDGKWYDSDGSEVVIPEPEPDPEPEPEPQPDTRAEEPEPEEPEVSEDER